MSAEKYCAHENRVSLTFFKKYFACLRKSPA
uniref:Uncharacterized protein n=1 Tax=Anguilla anguilla TaxID=7936 RepID=A0A0E9VYX5_ANGAN